MIPPSIESSTMRIVHEVVYAGCDPEWADMSNPRGEMYVRKYFITSEPAEDGSYRLLNEQFDSEYSAENWILAGFDITDDNSTLMEHRQSDLEAEWNLYAMREREQG